jgi:hypothetical protein
MLTTAHHQLANRRQNRATIGGTYGAEDAVATDALQDAQQPAPIAAAALAFADGYFTGPLGLNYRSLVRIPCSRPALRAVCG